MTSPTSPNAAALAGQPGVKTWNEHSNQLGDWCPWSGEVATDDACPAMCPASRAIAPVSFGLTETEQGILSIEQRRWRSRSAKLLAIADELDMTETRYYQVLSGLIDRPEALMFTPGMVSLLRARRARGHARRTAQE